MKWFAAGFAAITAYNAAIGWLAWDARSAMLAAILRDAEVAASTLTYEIEASLDTVDRTLSGLVEVMRAAPALVGENDHDAHRLLLRRHSITPQLKALYLIGPDGLIRNASSRSNIAPVDVSDRDYFQVPQGGARVDMVLGAPIESRLGDGWILPTSRAVEDRFGSLLAVVTGAFDPDYVVKLIAAQRLRDGFRVAVQLPNGRAVACAGQAGCVLGAPVDMRVPDGPRASGAQVSYLSGGAGPGAFGRGPRYGVVTAVVIDRSAALAGWWQLVPVFFGLSVFGSVAIVVGLIVLRRQMRARHLAMMALERVNAELERRVEARTQELSDSEERLRTFIRATLDAVIIVDGAGTVTEFNPAASRLFGYATDEVLGSPVGMLLPEYRDLALWVEGERQTQGRRRDGDEFPAELTVGSRVVDGRPIHVGVIRDITERRAHEESLRRLANTDGLTGVFNRRTFLEEGERLAALAQRHDRPIAVLMIDADHFKSVNDTHGHDVGDVVLRVLAQTVAARLRTTDVFGRLGGEEFGAILPETDRVGAERIAWAVVEAVRATTVALPGDGQLGFTVSVGVSARGDAGQTLAEMLKRADMALYRAKKRGRDRVVVYDGDDAVTD